MSLFESYVKRQVEVKAVQFTNQNKDRVLHDAQAIQMNVTHSWDENKHPTMIIPTSEGEMVCAIGDYLIVEPFPQPGRKLYPCKQDVFLQTYRKKAVFKSELSSGRLPVPQLTKENFWQNLHIRYSVVQLFFDWIDEYKKTVDWKNLFNSNSDYQSIIEGKNAVAPKYHDLPVAFQWGIFQQFCAEQYPSGFGGIESSFEHPNDMAKIPELITEYFAEMQSNADTERISNKYAQ